MNLKGYKKSRPVLDSKIEGGANHRSAPPVTLGRNIREAKGLRGFPGYFFIPAFSTFTATASVNVSTRRSPTFT